MAKIHNALPTIIGKYQIPTLGNIAVKRDFPCPPTFPKKTLGGGYP